MTLSARGLALGYGHHTVLRELSVDIAPGQCWAVLGNNGSGKTTLLHTLAGIRAPLGSFRCPTMTAGPIRRPPMRR